MTVSRQLKHLIIIAFAGLFSSGTAYWGCRLFLRQHGEFGDTPHPLEHVLGPMHLVMAFGFVFSMGIIWSRHVRLALRTQRNRLSGWIFFAVIGTLMLTGIAMIYGGETLMKQMEWLHPWVGISLLPILLYHWIKGHRTLEKRRKARYQRKSH